MFILKTYLSGKKSKLKAGEYLIPAHSNITYMIDQMAEGRVIKHFITIPEGQTTWQIVQKLNDDPILQGNIDSMPDEGSLYPDTYEYLHGDDRNYLIRQMKARMSQVIKTAWENRSKDLPFTTPQEALVLASVVEKETGVASERPRIARVFINRLNLKMPLQSDPTVIYGLSGKRGFLDRPLTRAELKTDLPHNTYVIRGLPPTPIACPGKDAINAVLNPDDTSELYFVADGSGGHAFTTNFNDHKEKVQEWRHIQQKQKS